MKEEEYYKLNFDTCLLHTIIMNCCIKMIQLTVKVHVEVYHFNQNKVVKNI